MLPASTNHGAFRESHPFDLHQRGESVIDTALSSLREKTQVSRSMRPRCRTLARVYASEEHSLWCKRMSNITQGSHRSCLLGEEISNFFSLLLRICTFLVFLRVSNLTYCGDKCVRMVLPLNLDTVYSITPKVSRLSSFALVPDSQKSSVSCFRGQFWAIFSRFERYRVTSTRDTLRNQYVPLTYPTIKKIFQAKANLRFDISNFVLAQKSARLATWPQDKPTARLRFLDMALSGNVILCCRLCSHRRSSLVRSVWSHSS
jgi:hypothetical protein